MLKLISHSIIAIFFAVSILGPSVFQLCVNNTNTDRIINVAEEEVKDKLLLILFTSKKGTPITPKRDVNSNYVEIAYTYFSEIVLPPPENLV